MSLIISNEAKRLPAELVNNAAFVKYIDFDPVHQSPESHQPAEKISGMAGRFDTVSISAEALAKAKDIRGLSPEAGPDNAEASQRAPVDITDSSFLERKKQGDALGRAMRSWNAVVAQLKQKSESSQAYGYGETRRLFQKGYKDWQAALQISDSEAHGAWLRMLEGKQ